MGLAKTYFSNTRKPKGLLGKMMLSGMNREHAAVSAWGMAHLEGEASHAIAELGCGGGRNAAALLERFPSATLTAVDYSHEAVSKTARMCAAEISEGRCRVLQGDVSDLPLETGSFDLVCAFETVYFWPGPVESFREVFRILEPEGTFLIVNESDGLDEGDRKWLSLIDGLAIYTEEELVRCLKEAGFSEARADRMPKKHWLCLKARK